MRRSGTCALGASLRGNALESGQLSAIDRGRRDQRESRFVRPADRAQRGWRAGRVLTDDELERC